MVKSKDKLKSLLIKVKESEKAGLKLNIQKTNSMAFSPTTSWQPEGENVETVADFIILGSKITADGDCTREIKRRLLLRRKAMTKLDRVLKSISSSVLRFLYSPYWKISHPYWKNHSFD